MNRVLIADDHAIVRRGVRDIVLEDFPGVEIVEVPDAEEFVKQVMSSSFDVAICDLNMPGRSGLDVLQQVRQIAPGLPVLIMSMHPEDQYALRVIKEGAYGYLSKDTMHEELIPAIRAALLNRKFITPSIAEKLAQALTDDGIRQPHEQLSNREYEVFKLLAEGVAVSLIAEKLSLSVTTISTYRSRILEKMHLKTNAELTRYALEKDIIR